MAKVYKCDRCGKYYDDETKGTDTDTYFLYKRLDPDARGFSESIDFCPECQEEFEAIVHKFLEREQFKPSEPLENLDLIGLYFGPGRVG